MKRLAVILSFTVVACFFLISPVQAQDMYGALAAGSDGSVGWAVDYYTQAEANNRALSECGSHCTIKVQFWNTCAAYAQSSNGSYGWAYGPTREAAESMALSECRKYASDCRIWVWGCTTH